MKPNGSKEPTKPRRRRAQSLPSTKTAYGAALRIRDLFEEIAKHHGRKVAQEHFRIFGAPVTPTMIKQLRNARVLDRLAAMPEPHPYTLGAELARLNKTLPRAERWGTGNINVRAMQKYVERLNNAQKARKAGASPIKAVAFILER
jgi:hypothetical protein